MSNTVTVTSDSPITVTQGPAPPAPYTVLSPDGFSIYSSLQFDNDTATIAAAAASISGNPNHAAGPGKTVDEWSTELQAQDAAWRAGGPAPVWVLGPWGLHFVQMHANQPGSPIGETPWAADDPATVIWNWNAQKGNDHYQEIPDWVAPYINALMLETLPGWTLGWGPVKK